MLGCSSQEKTPIASMFSFSSRNPANLPEKRAHPQALLRIWYKQPERLPGGNHVMKEVAGSSQEPGKKRAFPGAERCFQPFVTTWRGPNSGSERPAPQTWMPGHHKSAAKLDSNSDPPSSLHGPASPADIAHKQHWFSTMPPRYF